MSANGTYNTLKCKNEKEEKSVGSREEERAAVQRGRQENTAQYTDGVCMDLVNWPGRLFSSGRNI